MKFEGIAGNYVVTTVDARDAQQAHVNWTYMGKVAKAAEVDSLTMTIQEKGRAIKLSAPNCLGVVMPMKVDR